MPKDWNTGRFTLFQMVLACLLCIGLAGSAARYRYRTTPAPIISTPLTRSPRR